MLNFFQKPSFLCDFRTKMKHKSLLLIFDINFSSISALDLEKKSGDRWRENGRMYGQTDG